MAKQILQFEAIPQDERQKVVAEVLEKRTFYMTEHFFQTAVLYLLSKLANRKGVEGLIETWYKGILARAEDEVDGHAIEAYKNIFSRDDLVNIERAAINSVYSRMKDMLLGGSEEETKH